MSLLCAFRNCYFRTQSCNLIGIEGFWNPECPDDSRYRLVGMSADWSGVQQML